MRTVPAESSSSNLAGMYVAVTRSSCKHFAYGNGTTVRESNGVEYDRRRNKHRRCVRLYLDEDRE
jgi:hypothetical protein